MKNNTTALVILAMTAIAAIVGLVLMFTGAGTGNAAKTQFYGAPPVIIEGYSLHMARSLSACKEALTLM